MRCLSFFINKQILGKQFLVDGLTSWFAGCVIFVTLGYMSHQENVPIEEVVAQGWFKNR
jgi:hypothetical protein